MIGNPIASRGWRPQTPGRRNAKQIADPVIEPLWSGVRVLVHIGPGSIAIVGANGEEAGTAVIAAAAGAALDAESAVIDGYLTAQAARSGEGLNVGPVTAPATAGQLARQMLLGSARNRRAELVDALETAAAGEAIDDDSVLVATDLLLLDDEPLLDVPLLERKRLLDSVVIPGPLVRIGVHVRPPVDPWLGTWRSVGFRQLLYKEANSRYLPGERSDAWATADIPRD